MVAIPINKRVGVPVLSINGQAIAVANPGVNYQYLGVFLSTDDLSKPSLAKANSDIRFFSNMVLRKTVSDKQFSYLVSAVLQFILQAECKVLCWTLLNSLQYSVKLRVNTSNNFLVSVVCIFLDNKLSLDNKLPCAFCSSGCFPMLLVLDNPLYFNVVCSLKIADVAYGSMPLWFLKASTYLNSCLHASPPVSLASVCASVLNSTSFANIHKEIHRLWADKIDIYTDSFLKDLGMFQVMCGAAAYFLSLNKDLGVEVHGVLSSTLAKLQAVALALECVLASVSPDCRNNCWIERCHVIDLIKSKDLTVCWIKVKGHAGIAGNVMADIFAEQTAHSKISLPAKINCRYVVADGRPVSGNARHFIHDIFHSICKFQWEIGPGQGNSTTLVWHPDSHMLSGNMCRTTAALYMYFMKAVHFKLFVAVRKRLYNKNYSGVLCLFCGDMELPNHGFTCVKDASVQSDILGDFSDLWKTLMGPDLMLLSFVLQNFSLGVSDVGLYLVFCKGFVLKSWMDEAIASLGNKKKAAFVVVDFVHYLAESHRLNLWLFRTKFRSDIERSGLIGDDVVVAGALGVGALPLSAGMICLISVLDSLDVSFRNRFLFLSGAVHRVSVSISV
ncbi:hypothetical protein G9A89_021833 [Geosiphon pyriformis]|nr:hypothetical protein G9A89_021833 [Geosiphon pyriformis]